MQLTLKTSKLLKLLESVLDNKQSHQSLNYIYIDEDYLVVTDTRFLLAIPKPNEFKELSDCFIDNPKVKNTKRIVYTISKEEILDEVNSKVICKSSFKYPDWKRITYKFNQKPKYKFDIESKPSLFHCLLELTVDYNIGFNYEEYTDVFKKVQKGIESEISQVRFVDDGKGVEFEYEDGTLFLIMPMKMPNNKIFKNHE